MLASLTVWGGARQRNGFSGGPGSQRESAVECLRNRGPGFHVTRGAFGVGRKHVNRLIRVCGVAVAALIVFPVVGCGGTGGGLAPSSSPAASVASTTPAPTQATSASTPPAVTATTASPKPAPTHRRTPTAAPTHAPAATHTSPPARVTPTHSASAAPSCYPLTNGGNCYEPGEYCRNSDHGVTGVAGDGKAIKCEDNNGWRWEPV